MNYPVEIHAPDILDHRTGALGVDYVQSFASEARGPHVCVNAVMHGNEICGAIVLDKLLRDAVRPARGRLTFCFVNVDAFLRFDDGAPQLSRFVDEDMNRVWTEERLDSNDQSVELTRARQLRPIFDGVDYLLDIHSMSTLSKPILLCNGLDKERSLAADMGYPETVACGSGHVVGRRLIEYHPFNDPATEKTALLIECGQHWSADTVPVAMDTTMRFLHALGMLSDDEVRARLSCNRPRPQRMLEVTHGYTTKTDRFRFVEPFVGLEEFPRQGTIIAIDGDEEIRTPYDHCVLVMPHHTTEKNKRVLRFARAPR